jgi:hypothetical protein
MDCCTKNYYTVRLLHNALARNIILCMVVSRVTPQICRECSQMLEYGDRVDLINEVKEWDDIHGFSLVLGLRCQDCTEKYVSASFVWCRY